MTGSSILMGLKGMKYKGVRPSGAKGSFEISFQLDGIRYWETVQADNAEEAFLKRAEWKKSIQKNDGGDTSVDLRVALQVITKKIQNGIDRGELCKTSLSEFIPPFKRFFFDYPKHLGKEWKITADFNEKDFEGYKFYYGNYLKKPSGLSTEMRKISRIFTHFKEQEYISLEMYSKLRDVKKPRKNIRTLIANPLSDYQMVFKKIKEEKPRLYAYLKFLADTGRRGKEVRQYRRGDVNLDEGIIIVRAVYTKSKEDSTLPLSTELKTIVANAYDFSRKFNAEHLFLNDWGRPLSHSKPQEHFQKFVKDCGISNWKDWNIYQLKKGFITRALAAKWHPRDVQISTGHKDLASVAKHYYFPDLEQAKKVFESGKLKV